MEKSNERVIEALKGKTPFDVLNLAWVEEKFLDTFRRFHPKAGDPEGHWESEKTHFERYLFENPDLAACTGFTTYGVIVEMAVTGLSINPSWRLANLMQRNANGGTKQNPVWEKRMFYNITPAGELSLRQRFGQIKYADNPIVVYEGDLFRMGINEAGNKYIRYEAVIPRVSKNIIGAFMRIVRTDGSNDYGCMLQDDIERLSRFSKRNNSRRDSSGNVIEGKPNELYTMNDGQIDTGFLTTKLIKHSFKTYPRLQLGQFAQLETAAEEFIEEVTDVTSGAPSFAEEFGDGPVNIAEEVPSAGAAPRVMDEDGIF